MFTLVVLSVFARSAMFQASCHYPHGRHQPGNTPCYPRRKHSMCCGSTCICLSNGLCFVPAINWLQRGVRRIDAPYRRADRYGQSCTDGTWSADACRSICESCKLHRAGWPANKLIQFGDGLMGSLVQRIPQQACSIAVLTTTRDAILEPVRTSSVYPTETSPMSLE